MTRLSREEKRERLKKRQEEREARDKGGFGDVFDLLDFSGFGEIPIYELQERDNYISVVPYEVSSENHPDQIPIGEDDYKLQVGAHRNIGPKEEWVLCLKVTFGKPCPVCEEREFLMTKKGGGHDKKSDAVTALNPTRRCFYNIIDEGDKAKTEDVQLFENPAAYKPTKWFEALVMAEAKAGEETIAPWDIEDGRIIKVRGEVDKYQKGEFIKPVRVDFEDREPFDDGIYDEVYPLDKMLIIPTYDEVAAKFRGGGKQDQEEKEEATTERSRGRGRGKDEEKEPSREKSRGRGRGKDEEKQDSGRSRSRSRSTRKDQEKEEKSSRGRSRGRGRDKEESLPGNEEDIDGTCPYDYTFGVDFNKPEACADCEDEIWNACGDANKQIKEEDRKVEQEDKKEGKGRSGRRSSRSRR